MPSQRTIGFCVSYNGVCLQDCEVQEFVNRIEYDEQNNHKWDVIQLTVSTMIVSNSGAAPNNVLPVGNDDPFRLHHSQAIAGKVGGGSANGQPGYLATDNMLVISQLLKQPRGDLVVWINDASQDGDSQTVNDQNGNEIQQLRKPEHLKGRSSPRRIILAACGWAGAGDYPSPSTTEPEFVNITDPFQNTSDQVKTNILRRDVLDCDHGPSPQTVSIVPIAGGRAMRVTFSIQVCRTVRSEIASPDGEGMSIADEVAKRLSFASGVRRDPIIYNRWSLTDSEDESGRVTHTITGKLIVRDSRYKPNAMRLMAFPLAFPFARMASRRYAVSEDGKTLAYEFTFTHAGSAPPEGVRDYSATYSEKFSPYTPGLMHGSMVIRVKGWYHRSTEAAGNTVSEQTQKALLLRQSHTILYARIRGVAHKLTPIPGQDPKSVILLDLQVIEQVGLPEIELRVDVQYGPSENGDQKDIYLRLENMGKMFFEGLPQEVANYSPFWWPIENEWGRILNVDLSNPNYLYGPLGNTQQWKPYDDYSNTADTAWGFSSHEAPKTPSITQLPKSWKVELVNNSDPVDTGDLSGSRPDSVGASKVVDYPELPNPANQRPFAAVVSQAMNGGVIPASEPPKSIQSTGVFDRNQTLGRSSYISYEAEVMSDGITGVVSLPLSKARELAGGAFRPSNSSVRPSETSTNIRLFAGSGKRVLNVKAERLNEWPDMPAPAEQILRQDNVSGSPVVASIDRLIQKRIIDDAPQPILSGNSVVYTTNMQLVYSCSRPWSPSQPQAGYASDELFPLAFNEMLKHDVQTQSATKQLASQRFVTDSYS